MKNGLLPMNLQFFAELDEAGEQTPSANQQPGIGMKDAAAVDYDKIQQMLNGTLAAKEDTALKAYFKQQGMSEDEMKQAITAFKQQKAAQQPDVAGMQQQLSVAQAEALKAKVENAATLVAIGMGVDAKTVPYLLKMADLSNAVGADGKINEESITNTFNKVLEEIPALKPQTTNNSGFVPMGAGGKGQQQTSDDALKAAFGL